MEGGTRQWRVAEGGGGWHRMVEGGEREGNKSFMVVFLQQQPFFHIRMQYQCSSYGHWECHTHHW